MLNSKKILLLMSGSIAAYKICDLISQLKKQGVEIKVACTPSTLEFVGKASLEGLTGHPVQTSLFSEGQMMDHIYLNQWADLTLLAPASANMINKIAQGICDDLVSTLALARDPKKPFLIAPAMNTKMYEHPKTQESLQSLKSWGIQALPTETGELACGDYGSGKLLNNSAILTALSGALTVHAPSNKKHILITSGGTREAIDGVRYIGNMSSGRTGAELADFFIREGHQVTLLHGTGAQLPQKEAHCIEYTDFKNLQDLTREVLSQQHMDVVVQAAAISDYSVEKVILDDKEIQPHTHVKIDSGASIALKLTPNVKLVSHLKEYSKNKQLTVFAFKLTQTEKKSEQLNAVKKLISQEEIDYVIHNDLLDIQANKRFFSFYRSEKEFLLCKDISLLGERILTEMDPTFSSTSHSLEAHI